MCVVRTSSQRHSEQSFTYKTVPGTVYHMIRTSMLIGSMHRNVFDLVQNKYTRVIRLSVLYKTSAPPPIDTPYNTQNCPITKSRPM